MTLAILVTFLYFLPIAYICWLGYKDTVDAYDDGNRWENSILRFADWFYMILKRTDLGVVGLFISVLIHV